MPKYQTATFEIKRYEESQLYRLTGCIPECSKTKFELKAIKLKSQVSTRMELQIRLLIPIGEHDVIEEYFLYDFDSFIPDVGGYLGLLLGYSLLSMYHTFTQWLTIAKQWLLNSTKCEIVKASRK